MDAWAGIRRMGRHSEYRPHLWRAAHGHMGKRTSSQNTRCMGTWERAHGQARMPSVYAAVRKDAPHSPKRHSICYDPPPFPSPERTSEPSPT